MLLSQIVTAIASTSSRLTASYSPAWEEKGQDQEICMSHTESHWIDRETFLSQSWPITGFLSSHPVEFS